MALTLAALAVLLVRLSSAAEQPPHAGLSVTHAWARPTIGQLNTSAAYLRIENAGTVADRLSGMRADVSQTAELHETSYAGGVMRMRHLKDGIEVPAHGSLVFSPGGYHVMLIGLKAPLKKGQTFPLFLRFEKAGEIEVPVTVAVSPPPFAGTLRGSHR